MKRILIIDDDELTLTILTEVVESEGFEAVVARNGEEGLALYESQPVVLVITDMVMPVKNGIDTIIELRKKAVDLPIIAISGGGSIPKERYLELAGCMENTRTLAKPLSKKEIVEAMEGLLNSNQPPGEGIAL